jgi:hypothetical protein
MFSSLRTAVAPLAYVVLLPFDLIHMDCCDGMACFELIIPGHDASWCPGRRWVCGRLQSPTVKPLVLDPRPGYLPSDMMQHVLFDVMEKGDGCPLQH